MAARRVAPVSAAAAVVVAVAVAAPLLLAGVARADCFDYCFKDCISKDKSMTDYCSYACDKTCDPGAPLRPLAAATAAGAGDMGCQLSCARTSCNRLRPDCKAMETCFGQCFDSCETKTLPRPLRAGAGAGVPTALGSVPETGHPLFPASEPDPDHAVRAASEPKDHVVRPAASEPRPDDAAHV